MKPAVRTSILCIAIMSLAEVGLSAESKVPACGAMGVKLQGRFNAREFKGKIGLAKPELRARFEELGSDWTPNSNLYDAIAIESKKLQGKQVKMRRDFKGAAGVYDASPSPDAESRYVVSSGDILLPAKAHLPGKLVLTVVVDGNDYCAKTMRLHELD